VRYSLSGVSHPDEIDLPHFERSNGRVGMSTRRPLNERGIEFINTGEEVLIRARQVGQMIQERVWKVMAQHELSSPHAEDGKPAVENRLLDGHADSLDGSRPS